MHAEIFTEFLVTEAVNICRLAKLGVVYQDLIDTYFLCCEDRPLGI